MTKHNLSPKSGWMVCALGGKLAHRVPPNAVWIPYLNTTAHSTACGHVAVPADDDVLATYPKCPDCARPRSAALSSWFEAPEAS